ncbi:MAG: class I SAM-dependent methyltransferase [Pseudomonadota bacterium]
MGQGSAQPGSADALASDGAGWAGALGQRWAARVATMERQLAPIGDVGLAALAAQPGQRVLDIGCGGAATTRRIAEAVGPTGRVLGVDVSAELVAHARGVLAGFDQAAVLEADAGAHRFEPAAFDALFSRMGVMFFAEPVSAFANLHRALAPGAPLVATVFGPPGENPWAGVPARAAAEVMGPPEPTPPGAPGPFGWADPDYFAPILRAAGFSDVAWTAHEHRLVLAAAPDQPAAPNAAAPGADDQVAAAVARAVAFMTEIGTVARRLALVAPDDRPRITAAVAEALARALAPHVEESDLGFAVVLGARTWLVTARA